MTNWGLVPLLLRQNLFFRVFLCHFTFLWHEEIYVLEVVYLKPVNALMRLKLGAKLTGPLTQETSAQFLIARSFSTISDSL